MMKAPTTLVLLLGLASIALSQQFHPNSQQQQSGSRQSPNSAQIQHHNEQLYENKRRPQQPQQGYYDNDKKVFRQQQNNKELVEELSEELSDEKPDRLTELLVNSKFTCEGKKDGYYADVSLACEAFHYCQTGGKHSWLCPNQFAFHQIHLICVPPSSDNICKQSADFHFVNDYLYKPVNQKEADNYNATLKYADRFFPEGYAQGGAELLPYDNEQDYRPQQQQQHRQQQHRLAPQQQQQQQNRYQDESQEDRPVNQPYQQQQFKPQQFKQQHRQQSSPVHQYMTKPNFRAQSQPAAAAASIFYTPESVNIPLSQRRPLPTNFRPSAQIIKSNNNY